MTTNAKLRTTGIAMALLIGFGVAIPAHADSYINQVNPLDKQVTKTHTAKKSDRKEIRIRPASSSKTQNFGVDVRDTSNEGYGPNGRR